MQAVILAAGAGRRLRPVTLSRSKATVPVAGRTMIERIRDSLSAAGVTEFVVVVQSLDDDVAEACGAWNQGVTVRFACQPERRGMADALHRAAALLRGPFILTACDSLVDGAEVQRLVAAHEATGAQATLALERVKSREQIAKTGIVSLDGDRVTGIVEKPKPEEAPSDIASLPLYVFEPALLELLPQVPPSPRGEYELQDAIALLIRGGGLVHGLHVAGRVQVTTAEDLLSVNRTFLHRGETRVSEAATCLPPVHVGPEAELGRGCTIGPDTVLEDGCRLGDGAVVRRAVVLRGAEVPPGVEVCDEVVAPED